MKNLPTPYQDFIHKSRYARWIEDANRRESWDETVTRYLDYMCNHLQKNHGIDSIGSLYDQLYNSIIDLKVMPSMRAMMTAGEALHKDNI